MPGPRGPGGGAGRGPSGPAGRGPKTARGKGCAVLVAAFLALPIVAAYFVHVLG